MISLCLNIEGKDIFGVPNAATLVYIGVEVLFYCLLIFKAKTSLNHALAGAVVIGIYCILDGWGAVEAFLAVKLYRARHLGRAVLSLGVSSLLRSLTEMYICGLCIAHSRAMRRGETRQGLLENVRV